MTPARVQRTRRRGAPGMPPGARYVGRGTRWGNPNRIVYRKDARGWHVEHDHGAGLGTWPDPAQARRAAVDLYRHHLASHPELTAAARAELAGRDLACWCPLPAPGEPDHCHAAVLLEIANPEPQEL
ncbi:DUF4326 domain-containing protein [Streptomyces chumphonensis]|uniref:DUF4326 domain-containing protein n=1 Tax=Streptomyces chumphonensis TaxID=1214925 RepID=UPI003D748A9E